MVMLFDVKWIDDCTYELWPKKVLKGDKSMMGKKGDFMTVKIREIKEHSFMTETTSNFFDQTLFFEVDILR